MSERFLCGLSDDMEAFIRYRKSLGYSETTYLTNLKNLDRYCLEKHPDEKALSEAIVMGWLVRRERESSATLNVRAGFIRNFGRYLISLGKTAYVVPEKFTSSKSLFSPYLLTDEELSSFFHEVDAAQMDDPFVSYILSTIFRMIYTCGLRPNEGRMIERKNINLDSGEVLITKTKNKKERIIVMSDDMRNLATNYTFIRDIAYPNSRYLFPDKNGEPYTSEWLLRHFQYFFRRSHPEVPPEELPSVRVYDLRHRFATASLLRWMEQGIDIYSRLPYLRTYMGHTSLNATAYYIHLLPEKLVAASGIDWCYVQEIIPEVELWEE